MVSMSKIFSKNKSATWFWRNTPNTSATTVQQRDSLFNSSNWVLQVHIRTSPDASPENVGVFVGSDPTDSVTAPCTRFKKGEDRRKKERSFTSIKMLHTHTPFGQSRVNPERQEEERSGHTKGKRPKTAQGGVGEQTDLLRTNLHGETDLTKTAHTPKPHDTLRRGTRGN